MKNTRWTKKIQVIIAYSLILLFLALPVQAKPAEVNWSRPYYDNAASLTLPADDQAETAFDFQGQINSNYKAILIKAVKGNEQAYYYFPAKDKKVGGKVFLRFGKGTYTIEINLVKPSDPSVIEYDRLGQIKMDNTKEGDKRYLLPSWGIESDNQAIITLAGQITKGIKGDYLKAKAIHDWVSKNITYDMEKYNQQKFFDNEGAVKALQTKKGLCRDYSNLTTALCRAAGIEAKTVTGEAGIGSNWGGHAWNQVKVDNRWINLDTVWDAGSVRNNKFVSRFSQTYFDPAAETFNKTHRNAVEAL